MKKKEYHEKRSGQYIGGVPPPGAEEERKAELLSCAASSVELQRKAPLYFTLEGMRILPESMQRQREILRDMCVKVRLMFYPQKWALR